MAAGVPEVLAARFTESGILSTEDWCLFVPNKEVLEEFLQYHLKDEEMVIPDVSATNWKFCTVAARIRKLWKSALDSDLEKEAEKQSRRVAAPAPVTEGKESGSEFTASVGRGPAGRSPSEANGGKEEGSALAITDDRRPAEQLPGEGILPSVPGLAAPPKKLDSGDREKQKKEFEKRFEGTVVNRDILPTLGLLNTVMLQVTRKAWETIPWRKILSEGRVLELRKQKEAGANGREKDWDLLQIVAKAAGVQEEDSWEFEPSGAHEKVRDLLMTRAVAYVFLGACHWGSWTYYINAFMKYYKKKPSSTSLRGPNVQEAEDADQEAMQEVFDMCFNGTSLDDALYDVAITKDFFRNGCLRPQMKLPSASALAAAASLEGRAPKGGGKGKGGDRRVDLRPTPWGKRARSEGRDRQHKKHKTGICIAFQTGACRRTAEECKYIHICQKCYCKHDPRKECP